MLPFHKPLLVAFIPLALVQADVAIGQSRSLLRNNRLSIIDAQIGNQQVQRQTEVMRLERMLRQFESRVMRLERQLMSVSRLPSITIAEAKAGVEFAKLQLRESEKRRAEGEVDELQVAADRLSLARAQGQYDAAQAAHEENLILLEQDVLYAERHLREQNNEHTQLERLVAKGYASSSGLETRQIEVGLAEKQLQRARLRLETLKQSASQGEPPPERP